MKHRNKRHGLPIIDLDDYYHHIQDESDLGIEEMDTIEGWADAAYALVSAHLGGSSPLPIFDYSSIRQKNSMLMTTGGLGMKHRNKRHGLPTIDLNDYYHHMDTLLNLVSTPLNLVSTPWSEDELESIKECQGKECYATKHLASFAAKGTRRPYKCDACNCWHTGRSKGKSNEQQKRFKKFKKR